MVCLGLGSLFWTRHSGEIRKAEAAQKVKAVYSRLPLAFEANRGQTDPQVRFLARGSGYSFFLTSGEAVLALKKSSPNAGPDPLHGFPSPPSRVLRMELLNSLRDPEAEGLGLLPGQSSYFLGNDPARWIQGVPQYSMVRLKGVYPGIDMVYYGRQRQLEYDFVVAPGADPRAVRLKFTGTRKIGLDGNGNLELDLGDGSVVFQAPTAYQVDAGQKRIVLCRFAQLGGNQVGFKVGGYDHGQPLFIDPVLQYSTYVGGTGDDAGSSVATDAAGNAYVAGWTSSTDFPVVGPAQGANNSAASYNAFVSKIDPTGAVLVYSTYLGGTSAGGDYAQSIAVDGGGNAYITGLTYSTDFPLMAPIQAVNNAAIANATYTSFVSKLNAAGSALVYSTYLGGSGSVVFGTTYGDIGFGIATDAAGNAYIAGFTGSSDFPTQAPIQAVRKGVLSAFVTKVNAAGSAWTYSTYLGGLTAFGFPGFGIDWAYDIAVDGTGSAYVTGLTYSVDFPLVAPIQAVNNAAAANGTNAFVTKVNAAGSAWAYSTYLGGSTFDYGNGIAVDGGGSAYITGAAYSADFPLAAPIQATNNAAGGGGSNGFITKVNAAGGAWVYSTYLGGSDPAGDYGQAIAVDAAGDAYVTGTTASADFPVLNPIQAALNGATNAFITNINAAGSAWVYSTYMGGTGDDNGNGIALDPMENVYVSGAAGSTDFPTTAGAYQTSHSPDGGQSDAFVLKIEITPTPTFTSTPTSTATPTITPSLTPTITSTPTPDVVTACADSFYIAKNLFRPDQGPLQINVSFQCYPGQYSLRIYNSAGEFIRTLDSQYVTGPFVSSFTPWDGKNKNNEDVASGVYLFYLTEPFSRRTAKVLLVR